MILPPGQRAVHGLPRYGVNLSHPPPEAPAGMTIDVAGELTRRLSVAPAELADMPRCAVSAGLHCVAGWSAVGLRWEVWPFTIYTVWSSSRPSPRRLACGTSSSSGSTATGRSSC